MIHQNLTFYGPHVCRQHLDYVLLFNVFSFTSFTITNCPLAIPDICAIDFTQPQLQAPPGFSSYVHLQCKYRKGVAPHADSFFRIFLICRSELEVLPGSY